MKQNEVVQMFNKFFTKRKYLYYRMDMLLIIIYAIYAAEWSHL